jgi:hypothetical protein
MAEPVSLPPGSDNPPDSKPEPFTEEDVARLATMTCKPPAGVACIGCTEGTRAVLRALAEAGRLLPAGTPEITKEHDRQVRAAALRWAADGHRPRPERSTTRRGIPVRRGSPVRQPGHRERPAAVGPISRNAACTAIAPVGR